MRAAIEQTLLFDNTAPFSSVWRGLCANYMLIAAQPSYGLTADQIATEWTRVQRSGVKIVSTWCDQHWAMPSYPSGTANWNSADMVGFYAGLQAMKDRGIKVMVKAGWHFPQNVAALSPSPWFGPDPATVTPTPANEATYAQWVSDLCHQLINIHGFDNVLGLFFFTEPNAVPTGNIPAGYADAIDYYIHVVTTARDKIIADDANRMPIRPRILIGGPSEFSFTDDAWTEAIVARAPGLLDVYSAHTYYNSPRFDPLGEVADKAPDVDGLATLFTNWSGDASPKTLFADEGGFLIGGDTDIGGYRATADCGWQWGRQVIGHMLGGVSAHFYWLLADQPILNEPPLQYGTYRWAGDSSSVKPSWYAMSMLGNLLGGQGTQLYRAINNNSTLHGVGAILPSGDITFAVVNDSPYPVRTQCRFVNRIPSRTFYRYVYSAEVPPVAAADPAYLLAWDQRFANVGGTIDANVIPGRSIVCYSTINLNAPASMDLAPLATASSDSTFANYSADNVNDGNRSNVAGGQNGWQKADSSAHYVELDWPTVVTFTRIELAFVGTTPAIVYATYGDTSSPTPLADYKLQYWDGVSFIDFVTVTGNAQPNRTHTFAPITTTRLKFVSTGQTLPINHVGVFAS